jgi:uncharacterized membrane protein (DUF2068 family)
MMHRLKARLVASIGLHAIALFEAAKGMLVLLAGFGLIAVIPQNSEDVALRWVRHMHLNPASHYPQIFIDAAAKVSDVQLWWLAAGAFGYAAFRLVEAYGLWQERSWAEWLAVISGGLFVPLELYKIAQHATWPRVTLLALNLAIVAFMVYVLRNSKPCRSNSHWVARAPSRVPTGASNRKEGVPGH